MNKFLGVGRLSRNPELLYTDNGIAYCYFDVALNTRDDVDYITVKAWRDRAIAAARYLEKGRMIEFEGTLKADLVDNEKKIYVNAYNIGFLDKKKDSQEDKEIS